MYWHEMAKEQPPFNEYVWLWDMEKNEKRLIKYQGTVESWELTKDSPRYPIWAYLNNFRMKDVIKATKDSQEEGKDEGQGNKEGF